MSLGRLGELVKIRGGSSAGFKVRFPEMRGEEREATLVTHPSRKIHSQCRDSFPFILSFSV